MAVFFMPAPDQPSHIPGMPCLQVWEEGPMVSIWCSVCAHGVKVDRARVVTATAHVIAHRHGRPVQVLFQNSRFN